MTTPILPQSERDATSRRPCIYCGLRGHNRSTCHVLARRASRPDDADELAQRLVTDARMKSIADVRRAVARAIREARRYEASK